MNKVQFTERNGNIIARVPIDMLVYTIRGLEGPRRTGPDNTLTIRWTRHNRGLILENYPALDISGEPTREALTDLDLDLYKSPTKAYDYQQEAVERALEDRERGYAIFSSPGTGKSKMALDIIGHLRANGIIDRALIVAPAGVHRQWEEQQIPQHMGGVYNSHAWGNRKAERRFTTAAKGPPGDVRKCLSIMCINPEALIVKKTLTLARDWLREATGFILVLDESHMYKNRDSKRHGVVKVIGNQPNCKFRLLLTGTPLGTGLEDLWSQMDLIDKRIIGIDYKTTFRRKYCIMGGYMGRDITGYRQVDEFNETISPHYYRITKSQIGMIPKQYSLFNFDLLPAQRKMIKSLANDMIAQIDSETVVEVRQAAVLVQKVQQVSNGWIQTKQGPDNIIDPSLNPRLIALHNLIQERNLKHHPVAIWCRYLHDIALIKHYFTGKLCGPIYEYSGRVKSSDRDHNRIKWLRHGGIFVGTPGAGGVGLNLQGTCNDPIYFSNSENYIQRVQSEDRFHRIGTKGIVTYTDIIARGTRDYAILANLKRKKSIEQLTLSDIKRQLEEIA